MGKSTVTKVEKLITEKLQEEEFADCYIVDIEHPANNRLNIFLDSDSGITFTTCRKISRYIEAFIDEEGWMGEKYTLEVSSPGITRPLKLKRQYPKNVGRKIKVKTTVEDEKEVAGTLIAVNDEKITVEYSERIKEGKKKRTVVIQKDIPYDQIKEAKIQISYKK